MIEAGYEYVTKMDYLKLSLENANNLSKAWGPDKELGMGVASLSAGDVSLNTPFFDNEIQQL